MKPTIAEEFEDLGTNFLDNNWFYPAQFILVFLGAIAFFIATVVVYMFTPSFAGFNTSGHPVFYMISEAFLAFLLFGVAFLSSVLFLIKKRRILDSVTIAAAKTGVLASILTLGLGIFWSKVEWGYYWQWEPRQTMTLIMLLFYLAMILFRSTVDDVDDKAKLSAIFGIGAFPTIPMTNFIVGSLHPTPQGTELGGSAFLGVLLFFIATFLVYLAMFILTVVSEELSHQVGSLKTHLYMQQE